MLLASMDDANQNPPDPEDTTNWADELGLTHPVLADDQNENTGYVLLGYPTFVVIDREMVIQNADMWPWDDAFVEDLIEDD